MKSVVWIILLALTFGLLVSGAAYSQNAEPIQRVTKDFSPDEAKRFFADWGEKNKMKAMPTVNVSGDWCIVKESVPSGRTNKPEQKITINLQQDKNGKVNGYLQVHYLENNEWKTGTRFMLEGKVSENMLVGKLLDAKDTEIIKLMLTFRGNAFEGVFIDSTTPTITITETSAVRCSG